MDIEHPDIDRIQRTGYPSGDYIEYECEKESSEKED